MILSFEWKSRCLVKLNTCTAWLPFFPHDSTKWTPPKKKWKCRKIWFADLAIRVKAVAYADPIVGRKRMAFPLVAGRHTFNFSHSKCLKWKDVSQMKVFVMTTRTLVISQNPTQQNDFSCILKFPIIIIFAAKLIQILDNSKIPKFLSHFFKLNLKNNLNQIHDFTTNVLWKLPNEVNSPDNLSQHLCLSQVLKMAFLMSDVTS